MSLKKPLDKIYQFLLSKHAKEKCEHTILWLSMVCFLTHLLLIGLVHFNVLLLAEPSDLLKNPIAAIYTPFSFILVYEVYLLIYYLPKSTSNYISKQYEIIALIIIRRLFKDLSNLNLTADWFNSINDLQFTYDLIASILLFFMIYLFHIQRSINFRTPDATKSNPRHISKFINAKKWVATALVMVLFFIASYSFFKWSQGLFYPNLGHTISFKNINNIFFEQFFNILIIADVLLLLFSFFHTDEFHKVMRNSGFIISTILIRLSFSTTGIINTALIVSAILFGLLILYIYNQFEKKLALGIIKESNNME